MASRCTWSLIKTVETDDEVVTKKLICKENADSDLKVNKKTFATKILPGKKYCRKHAKRKQKSNHETAAYLSYLKQKTGEDQIYSPPPPPHLEKKKVKKGGR